jgi:hypothetical protein
MRRVALAVSIFVGGLSGCATTQDVPFDGGSCENVPSSACNEQMQAAANSAGGAVTDVAVVCTAPACTRAGGSGTATVTRRDGTRVTLPWAYVGDPGPQPVPACNGLPADVCRRELASVIGEVPVDKRIVRITVTCTDKVCDTNEGHIQIDYAFADGSRYTGASGWGP